MTEFQAEHSDRKDVFQLGMVVHTFSQDSWLCEIEGSLVCLQSSSPLELLGEPVSRQNKWVQTWQCAEKMVEMSGWVDKFSEVTFVRG